MSAVDARQGRLDLKVVGERSQEVTDAVIYRQKTQLRALQLCCQGSGLDHAQIADALKMNTGQFSRIFSGQAHLAANLYNPLQDICGNEILLKWQANSRGYGLHLLKSEQERRIEEKDARIEQLENELQIITNFVKGTR